MSSFEDGLDGTESAIWRELEREISCLQAENVKLKTLLNYAQCPECDGSGAYYDGMSDSMSGAFQCHWCNERNEALKISVK